MQESGKSQFAVKKAYEISYAILRIGGKITSLPLKDSLDRQALALIEATVNGDYASARRISGAIEYLVKLGGDTGVLHEANAETLIAQLHVLNPAIEESGNTATLEPVNLDDIFTGQEPLFTAIRQSGKKKNTAIANAAIRQQERQSQSQGQSGNEQSEIRHTAILDKIRQSGNCRLRDILELLPDCSERTIRYDLQSLAEQNLVERVGNGGPSVFYRIPMVPGVA